MSERPVKVIYDCSTNTETIVELTDEEIAQKEADMLAFQQQELEKIAEEEAKAAAKASAIAKLTALGLTEEEALAIIGQ